MLRIGYSPSALRRRSHARLFFALAAAALLPLHAAWGDDGTDEPQSEPAEIDAAPTRDNVSDAVGATLATFRVDEGGNATYSIPIQIPPGTAGLAPKLALTYSSRAPIGPLGPGWNIEGASQISRCRQTRESGDFMSGSTPIDGNPPPINFTTSDRYCLDGVRLLVISGGYGFNGSVYSPENDPSTRVTATVTNGIAGPDSFLVQRKDGLSVSYGDVAISPASRVSASRDGLGINVSWNLSRMRDSTGNVVDFLYQSHPSGSAYPFSAGAVETVLTQVKYTGNVLVSGAAPYASVNFTYATLPVGRVRLGYQGNIAFLQSQQLSGISVQDQIDTTPRTLRYYKPTYTTSPSGSGAQILSQIQECRDAATPGVCFAPTVFGWSAAVYSYVNDTTQTQTGPDYTNLAGYKVADIDGDGRQDIVFAKNGDSACPSTSRLYVSFLDRTSSNQLTLVTPGQAAICAPINLANNDAAWQLLDYDGDGRADLLIGGAAGSNWAGYASQGRPAPGGRVFGTVNLFASLTTPITVPMGTNAAATLADVNGDGLVDFIYAGTVNSYGYSFILARLATRQNGVLQFSDPYSVSLHYTDSNCGGANTICTVNFFTNDPAHRFAITSDINGDGRGDLTLALQADTETCMPTCPIVPDDTTQFDPTIGTSTQSLASVSRKFFWYQFVASGITQPSGSQYPVINFNEYWSQSTAQSGGTLPNTSDKLYVLDMNGDGLADIVYQDQATASTYWALINTGNGYQDRIAATGIVSSGVSPPVQFADINGDGRTDIVFCTSPTSASFVSISPSAASATGWAFTAVAAVAGGGIHASANWIGLLGDFDGDGTPDFVSLQTQATNNNLYTSRAAPTSRYHPRDVIVAITNGNGAVTNIAYQPLTNNGVYQRGRGGSNVHAVTEFQWGYRSPVLDVLAPIYVVSQASSSAPQRAAPTALSTVYYRYAGALMQAGGRGFLGFWETWAFDGNDNAQTFQNVVTVNGYGQDYPFIGMPEATFKLVFNGAVTRGTARLDACAANPEVANYNCFAAVGDASVAWPDLISAGKVVGNAGAQPVCVGNGCPALDNSTCTSTSSPPPELDQSTGLFTPPPTAGPVFSFISHSYDVQGDLSSGQGPSNTVALSQSLMYSCYEDGRTNLTHARSVTLDGGGTIVAQKLVANTYADDTTKWFLGRLSNSVVKFLRPGLPTVTRTSDFTYDATTGLLNSERVQKNLGANQDLRTFYILDAFGNRTAAYQCSAELSDASCVNAAATLQQPLDATGHSGTLLHRYAKTQYDARGRYVIANRLPFYSATATNHLNEQSATTVGQRDEFGNPTQQSSINGITQTASYGSLGRPYYGADNTGKAVTTTYRYCNAVSCPSDAKFRMQTIAAGAPGQWVYYDVLGRPILTVKRSFDLNNSLSQFSAVCSYYDAHNRPSYVSEPFFPPASPGSDGSPSFSNTFPCSSGSYATTSVYDVLGRTTKITHPDFGTVTTSYIGLHTFTTDPRGFTYESTTNALGEVIETRDPDSADTTDALIASHTYDAVGDLLSTSRDAGSGLITTSASYDALGRKISMSDPDAGYSTFAYNAAGETIKQTDAKNQAIQSDYDALGRVWRRTAPGADGNTLTDTWTFDTAANGYGLLANEARSASAGLGFGRVTYYDAYGRLRQRTTSIAGSTYSEVTAYDGLGRPRSQQDATGYTTTRNYTASGYLSSLTDSRAGTVYEVLSMTARGQIGQDRRGGSANLLGTMIYQASTGRPMSACAGVSCALQDLSYQFDLDGNLTQRVRSASTAPTIETASYDALNRLTATQLTKVQGTVQNPAIQTAAMTYDKLGNICTNGGIAYAYAGRAGCANHGNAGSPHAVTSRVGVVNYTYDANGNFATGSAGRMLSWNALNQLTRAAAGTVLTTFDYAPDGSRFRRTDSDGTNPAATVYIVGNVEFVIVAGNAAANITRRYLAGAAIDFLYGNGTRETRYTFSDHLGSLSLFANSAGANTGEQSFNAFGNLRNPVTWQGTGSPMAGTPRGFTGHEAINALNLVHMNGRLYDPQMGRMLQPDPLADGSNQGLNRYSYVINNPLTLTDPSGYSWWRDILAIAIVAFAPELAPAFFEAYGALAWAAAGFIAGVVQSGNLQGGIYGAFSATLFYGIGNYFKTAVWARGGEWENAFGSGYSYAGYSAKVLAHGIAGGVMSSLEGGKFGNGFASAGVTEAFSEGIDQIDARNAGFSVQRIFAAAVVGGSASAVSGGKFANGAVTGAFSRSFNDEATKFELQSKINDQKVHVTDVKDNSFTGPLSSSEEADVDAINITISMLGETAVAASDLEAMRNLAAAYFNYVPGYSDPSTPGAAGYEGSWLGHDITIRFASGFADYLKSARYMGAVYNHYYFFSSGPTMALFLGAHELGHTFVGSSEIAADNYAYHFIQNYPGGIDRSSFKCVGEECE